MKAIICIPFAALLLHASVLFAQNEDQEEKKEEKTEHKARLKDKTDYGIFHRQMLSLKEYNDERRKIPAIQKANKERVKVTIVIDSAESDDDVVKTLTGYIRLNIGDDAADVYEVSFDRGTRKIVAVKPTGDKPDEADNGGKGRQKAKSKKATDDDDDEATDDDKPAKKSAHKKDHQNEDDDDDDGK